MLDKINKQQSPFKVPENYFENFNAEIMTKLPEKKTSKVVPLWKKVAPWTAIAAVLGGILFSVGIYNKTPAPMVAEDPTGKVVGTSLAVTEEEDFYMYLEDEATTSMYRDILYNEN